jgi:hypothetical protein
MVLERSRLGKAASASIQALGERDIMPRPDLCAGGIWRSDHVTIEISPIDYSQIQLELYLVPLAKIGKVSVNTADRYVREAFLGHPTSIMTNNSSPLQPGNSARFSPPRDWVAKIGEYCRVPVESNIMTGAIAPKAHWKMRATLGIGVPGQWRNDDDR